MSHHPTYKTLSPNRFRRVQVTLPSGNFKIFATREDAARWAAKHHR